MKIISNYLLNKTWFILFMCILSLSISIMFFYSYKYRYVLNISKYTYSQGYLSEFSCRKEKDVEYHSYVINDERYRSFYNNKKINVCESLRDKFSSLIGENVEIWTDKKEIIQLIANDNVIIDMHRYVYVNKQRALKNAILLLLFSILTLFHFLIKWRKIKWSNCLKFMENIGEGKN